MRTVPYTCSINALGTNISQRVYGINAEAAARQVNEQLLRLNYMWSPAISGNVVDGINITAGGPPVCVDKDTTEVLSRARQLGECTNGAFDVTIEPLIRTWQGFLSQGQTPGQQDLIQARSLVDFRDLCIGDCQVSLSRPGQGINLGGIAKGFAADMARKIYENHGIRYCLLNMGGHVLSFNTRPDGSDWKVGITNPFSCEDELVGYVEVASCSVVTSGQYRQPGHILDPGTGQPADSDVAGITIVTPRSVDGDALATAVIVLGMHKGLLLCRSLPDIDFLAVDTQGRVHVSAGLASRWRGVPGTSIQIHQ